MPLRESIMIAADAATVWPLIADPVRQAAWNPNIISLDRRQTGAATLHERFALLYRLGRRESQSQVEVIAWEPLRRIVFRHQIIRNNAQRIVEEAYDIVSCTAGVRVVQTIALAQSGIPWPIRGLIWFTHRFGWTVGRPHLHRLKQQAECPAPVASRR